MEKNTKNTAKNLKESFINDLKNQYNNFDFLTKENKTLLAFSNIEKKDGHISFTAIHDYYNIINYNNLSEDALYAYELFTFAFKSTRNAIHCTLKAIKDKKPFSDATFEKQSSISFIGITAEQKKIKTFSDLLKTLTEEEQNYLFAIAKDRLQSFGYTENQFDFFYIAKEEESLKESQIIGLKDSITGYNNYYIISQITPKGFISIMDTNGNINTLTNIAYANMITELRLDNSISEALLTAYNEALEDSRIERDDFFNKSLKKYEKTLEKLEKELKKELEAQKKAQKKEEEAKAKIEQEAKATTEAIIEKKAKKSQKNEKEEAKATKKEAKAKA